MMNRIFLTLSYFIAACLFSSAQQTDSTSAELNLMPAKHLVPLFTADTRAHRLSAFKTNNGHEFVCSMGGFFSIVEKTTAKRKWQVSLGATNYITIDRWALRGRLTNTDYFIDLFVDLILNKNWTLRGVTGHTSQHLTDDALQDGLKVINYLRDYGQVFGVYKTNNQKAFFYGGVILNANFKTTLNLSPKLMFQTGFEHCFHQREKSAFYWAGDVKFRGEFNFGTTRNVQLGYKMGDPLAHQFRFALNYTSGYEERGQFYTRQRDFFTAGICFDF